MQESNRRCCYFLGHCLTTLVTSNGKLVQRLLGQLTKQMRINIIVELQWDLSLLIEGIRTQDLSVLPRKQSKTNNVESSQDAPEFKTLIFKISPPMDFFLSKHLLCWWRNPVAHVETSQEKMLRKK